MTQNLENRSFAITTFFQFDVISSYFNERVLRLQLLSAFNVLFSTSRCSADAREQSERKRNEDGRPNTSASALLLRARNGRRQSMNGAIDESGIISNYRPRHQSGTRRTVLDVCENGSDVSECTIASSFSNAVAAHLSRLQRRKNSRDDARLRTEFR